MANNENEEGEHFEAGGTVHAYTEQPLNKSKRAAAVTLLLIMAGDA
jgi:hypothetical protein